MVPISEYIWSQEEHRNMGAWSFIAPRFENVVGCKVSYYIIFFSLVQNNMNCSGNNSFRCLTIYLRDAFKRFCKQSKPRSGRSCKSCLIRVYSACGNTDKTLYNITRYNRIFNIRHKIDGNGSVSIKFPSL